MRGYLERLNRQVMKDYGVSRAQRFEEEKRQLKALPPTAFELSEWRRAKVHPDYHVQVEKNFYSTPFVYVGQNVRVRLTAKMVEVFSYLSATDPVRLNPGFLQSRKTASWRSIQLPGRKGSPEGPRATQ